MKITEGLFDNMVLQRNTRNRSDAAFSGDSRAAGVVRVRVTGGRVAGSARRWTVAGAASHGRIRGRICDLPAGGPYDFELRIENALGRALDSCRVHNVLVGDVWVLAGQSNMEGIGYLRDAAKPHPMVRAFYMNDRWGVARDPVHNIGHAVDPVHAEISGGQNPQRPRHVGVGPGVAFGQEMHRRTGVPQGLIACAHGGTSMAQWDPAGKKMKNRSLYGAMLRRFRKNGGRVAGVVWYQGCSDTNAACAAVYGKRMKTLVSSMRRDMGDSGLPFVAVQIATVTGAWDAQWWNSIQEQERRLPETIRRCLVTPAVDLSLDDGIHISGKDQKRLGARLAEAMCVLKRVPGAGKPPIALDSVKVEADRVHGSRNVRVSFRNVVGRLQAPGRPSGFDLAIPGLANAIYRTDLVGNAAILRTDVPIADPRPISVFYGRGTMPYCNITDAADRSLPVFGPVHTKLPEASTDPVRRISVSRAMPSAGKLGALAYPGNKKALGLEFREFTTDFCDLHLDLFACAPRDVVAFFLCRLRCAERMRLQVCLGYDGPVKAWIDGKCRFHDPAGTNPAIPDAARIPLDAAAGMHEVLVALGSNSGKAWGMFLRFRRLDVTARQLKLGPTAYRLPDVLAG